MAAGHPVSDDINPVSLAQQIQRSLRDADMCFNTHNGYLIRILRALSECEAQFRDEHGEGRFVDGIEGVSGGSQLGADGAEPRFGLCGGIDGDGEGLAGSNEFLGGGYAVQDG